MNERDKYQLKLLHDGAFDYSLPRPPALGEEQIGSSNELRGASALERGRFYKSSSPIPKTSFEVDDGFRPNSRPSSRHEKSYFTWAESLHHLLQDPDGVKLFQRYLESEGAEHANPLQFWFVCEGLKKHDQDNIQKLVKCIYKRYFLKYSLPIDDELRKQIMKRIKSPQCLEPPITLFDEAQTQIEALISKTTYPNFLKSDMYLQYIQSIENPSYTSEDNSASVSPTLDKETMSGANGPLPTLHEDLELNTNLQPPFVLTPGTGSVSTGYHTPTFRLTKDMLLRSQKHRALDIRPKSEAFAGLIHRSHIAYNSFNPVSRQDSEMQSLSSDARTESDSMSIHVGRSKEEQIRQLAARNRETDTVRSIIPRTSRIDWEQKCRTPITAAERAAHAAEIIEKLERLKRARDSEEVLDRCLRESESMSSLEERASGVSRDIQPAMPYKLHFQDDSDQDILDEHVSRVFSDHSIDSGNVNDYPELSERGAARRVVREYSDPMDSGISVVSDSLKDRRVISWLRASERSEGVGARSEMGIGEKVVRKFRRERGSSLERATPAQPFVADPSMPPLTQPNVDLQLEEIRRRLTEDDAKTRCKQRSSSQSGQSTLRKSMRRPAVLPPEDMTTAVFSFDDEQLPYRSKIPGTQITLKQFKQYLPKKGNFRFFFKTVCENQVTQEEAVNDNEILPLWEGKIIAKIKALM